MSVELAGSKTYGFTTFAQDKSGPHRIAWDANREQSLEFYLTRILSV